MSSSWLGPSSWSGSSSRQRDAEGYPVRAAAEGVGGGPRRHSEAFRPNRSSPCAPAGTTGDPAGTTATTGATRVAPSGGLGSDPPLLGQYEKARSARAAMVSAGLAPGLAGMAEPSTT